MKISDRETADRFAHLLDQPLFPLGFVQAGSAYVAKALGPSLNGFRDEEALQPVFRHVEKAIDDFRAFNKEQQASWGVDRGPTDAQLAVDFRMFFEFPVPESFTYAIDELVRAQVDRGTSTVDALERARATVAKYPPPTEVSKLDVYLARAGRIVLEQADHERLLKRF